VTWFLARNLTGQDEPDVRFFRNYYDSLTLTSTRPPNSTEAQNTRRIFREIEEENGQAGADLVWPFAQWSDLEGKIQVGLRLDRTDRTYDQKSLTYIFPIQAGNAFTNPVVQQNQAKVQGTATQPDILWTDFFLEPGRIGLSDQLCAPGQSPYVNPCAAGNQLLWVLTPVGNDVDYDADQTIDGSYAMAELPLVDSLQLIAGLRVEHTELAIDPVGDGGLVEVIEIQPGSGDRAVIKVNQAEAAADISQTDLLPSAGLIWTVVPDMKLRASWSRTIARPTFRELAPVATEEFIFGDEFIGNPDLVLSDITNYDLRWEWFRRPGEVLAASVFFKELRDPIELISFSASNRSFVQPLNFEKGTLKGFELEARTGLDLFSDRLRGLAVGVNYSLLDTEVDVPAEERESLSAFGLDEPTRRLQGQPEYLFNFNVTYDHDATGTSASLFYNRTGETLLTGAARNVEDGNPNVFEKSIGVLDVTVHQVLRMADRPKGPRLALDLRVKNLLQPDKLTVYRVPSGQEEIKTERETPVRITLSASAKW
jgi:TonB-dependent receptor